MAGHISFFFFPRLLARCVSLTSFFSVLLSLCQPPGQPPFPSYRHGLDLVVRLPPSSLDFLDLLMKVFTGQK
ncbi:hypothetical protein BXZ70DRAFT_962827 [Cristinia sonorae]|uniref:Secreted protein n=1 Tax=Cristinia sonorae TaxID=1940300 RepID=A0A8K0UDG6_9AGAR|nr:hypothetical protein BXZ70DRAFT_962827 [Cristinia sonorae]